MPAHPAVRLFKAVEADGDAVEAGAAQRQKPFGRESQAIGYDASWQLAAKQLGSDLFQISAHGRFAARDDNVEAMALLDGQVRQYGVDHTQEILGRHIGMCGRLLAVAAAVPASQVAAVGAFPEKLTERMLAPLLKLYVAEELEGCPFAQ